MKMTIRPFRSGDETTLNEIAGAAFAQYESNIPQLVWAEMYGEWCRMSNLQYSGAIHVALYDERIVGGVCYLAPHCNKPSWFDPHSASIRSLVVHPMYRAMGLATSLTKLCVDHATADNSSYLELHTAPFMESAVRLYERIGFKKCRDLDLGNGVPWVIYRKKINETNAPHFT